MRRIVPTLLGLGLAGALAGCLEDLADDCQTDADCGPAARCVLDGVRICAPRGIVGDGGTTGSGGTAGTGGSAGGGGTAGTGGGGAGGTAGGGGTAGSGGSGGSGGGVEVDPVPVQVGVSADAPLAAYLGAHARDVREIVVRAESAGAKPAEQRFVAEPGEAWALGDGAEPLAFPLEIRAAPDAEVRFTVEAYAATRAGALARFAVGTAIRTIDASAEVAVELALVGDFDFDGDGAFDAADDTSAGADCAPDDERVHPGAAEVCDGVDTDCRPAGTCIVPLPDGHTVRDVICDGADCFVAWDGAGPGAVSRLGEGNALADFALFADPAGVAVNPADGGGATVLVYDASSGEVRSVRRSNPTRTSRMAPTGTISGRMAVSPRGKLGFALYADGAAIEVFDAPAVASSTSVTNCIDKGSGGVLGDLLGGGDKCAQVMLNVLSDGTSALSLGTVPSALAVRQTSDVANAQVYLTFDRDPRLGIAVFQPGGNLSTGSSGLLAPFSGASPVALALNGARDRLYVAGAGDAPGLVTLTAGSTFAAHTASAPTALPAGTCPTGLAVQGSTLVVADACNDRLLVYGLDAGGQIAQDPPAVRPLPAQCAPAAVRAGGSRRVVQCASLAGVVVDGAD